MAISLGVFTPFADFIRGIPSAVVGGASLILFGMIAANGLRALVDAKVNFSSTKNMMVVSITLALGLGLGALSLSGKKIGFSIKGGGFVEISSLVAVILNLIIPSKRGKTQEEKESEDKPLYTLAGKVIDEEKDKQLEAPNEQVTEQQALPENEQKALPDVDKTESEVVIEETKVTTDDAVVEEIKVEETSKKKKGKE